MPPAPSSPFRIVINYRRDDTAGHAGRLYDALATRFGHDHVFMDIDAIEPGVDFTQVLDRAVDSCDAFISLIGREWLTATDARGRRRLDNPGDFVRLEIEAALDRDIRLIPVLVQEAEMPSPEDLPDSLARLAHRNAFEVRDTRWRSDVEQLIRVLEKIERDKAAQLAGATPPSDDASRPRPRLPVSRRALVGVAAGALLVLGGVVAIVALGGGGGEPAPTGETGGTETDAGGGDRGRTIIYSDGTYLYAVEPEGSEPPMRGPEGAAPDWSPDAQRIAFVHRGRIVVMNADESGRSVLTSGTPRDHAPSWSPDGERIAFDRTAGGSTTRVVVIGVEDGVEQVLTEGSDTGGAPDWSPDGDRIVYHRRGELWTMNADGSGKEEIARDVRGTKLSPAWSPDRDLIAFALYPGTGREPAHLYVVRPDGSEPRRVTHQRLFSVNYPAWSADGERLLFTAQGGLWVIPSAGGAVEDVRSGPTVESPSWAPAD